LDGRICPFSQNKDTIERCPRTVNQWQTTSKNYIHKDKNSRDLDVPLVKIPVVNLGLVKSLSTKKDELLSSHTPTQYIITYIL
jgi:hypothetical protein